MKDYIVLRNLEVHVDLHSSLVSMCRHRVPYTARLKNGHTHRQLAGLQNVRMDELVDHTLVGSLHCTNRSLCSLLDRNKGRLACLVCRRTYHIELSRMLRIFTCEEYLFRSLCDVQAILVSHLESLAICGNASSSANVENTDLTALKEILGTEVLPDVDALVDGNGLRRWHASKGYHTIYVRIHSNNLVRHI